MRDCFGSVCVDNGQGLEGETARVIGEREVHRGYEISTIDKVYIMQNESQCTIAAAKFRRSILFSSVAFFASS